jgi:hypothetical protein
MFALNPEITKHHQQLGKSGSMLAEAHQIVGRQDALGGGEKLTFFKTDMRPEQFAEGLQAGRIAVGNLRYQLA